MRKFSLICLFTLGVAALIGNANAGGGAGCSHGDYKGTQQSAPKSVDKTRTATPAIKTEAAKG